MSHHFDFIYKLALCAAILVLLFVVRDHSTRIAVIEGAKCPAHCRPMQEMLRNRRISPIHSFARSFDVCPKEMP